MIMWNMGLSFDNIQPGRVDHAFAQDLRKGIAVYESPSTRIDEDRRSLHPPQERLIDDMIRRLSPGRQHEHDVRLTGDIVQRRGPLDAPQAELAREGPVVHVVGGGAGHDAAFEVEGGVGGVGAVGARDGDGGACEGGFGEPRAGGGRVGVVDGVGEAEGDEAGQCGFGDAAEADEAGCALVGGVRGA